VCPGAPSWCARSGALDDEYFTSRKLYPNVDAYSKLIYGALGLPVAMSPMMFATGRTRGWIAQWLEMVEDPEQKIAGPRQIYAATATASTCRSTREGRLLSRRPPGAPPTCAANAFAPSSWGA
jgi:hypothetical protein